MNELGDVVCEADRDSDMQGWIGKANCTGTIKLLHTLSDISGLPGILEKSMKVKSDFRAEAGNLILVGNDEDVHIGDQAFIFERILISLSIRQAIDVANHGMNCFGIIPSEVDAGSSLIKE